MATRLFEITVTVARIERLMAGTDLTHARLVDEIVEELVRLQEPIGRKDELKRQGYYKHFKPAMDLLMTPTDVTLHQVVTLFNDLLGTHKYLPRWSLRQHVYNVLTTFCIDKSYPGTGVPSRQVAVARPSQARAGPSQVPALSHAPVAAGPAMTRVPPVDRASLDWIVIQTTRNIEAHMARCDITKDYLVMQIANELQTLQTWFHTALGDKPRVTQAIYSNMCTPFNTVLWRHRATVMDVVLHFADAWAAKSATSIGYLRNHATKLVNTFCSSKKFPVPEQWRVVYPVYQDPSPSQQGAGSAMALGTNVCLPAILMPDVDVPVPAPAATKRHRVSRKNACEETAQPCLIREGVEPDIVIPETPREDEDEIAPPSPPKKAALSHLSQAPEPSWKDQSDFNKFFIIYAEILRKKNLGKNIRSFRVVQESSISPWNVHSIILHPMPGSQSEARYVVQFATRVVQEKPGMVHTRFVLRSLNGSLPLSLDEIKVLLHHDMHRLSADDSAFVITTTTGDNPPLKNARLNISATWFPVNERTKTSVRSIIVTLISIAYHPLPTA
jgi:hypothetical protein